MREKRCPVVLLAEIDDAIRLDTHAQTRTDRDVALKCLLSGGTGCSVLAAGGEYEQSKSTSSERPVTLHKLHLGE